MVNDKAPKDRDIAMVFQNYALYPHMTVRENMGFALTIFKFRAGEDDEWPFDGRRIEVQNSQPSPARMGYRSGGRRLRAQ